MKKPKIYDKASIITFAVSFFIPFLIMLTAGAKLWEALTVSIFIALFVIIPLYLIRILLWFANKKITIRCAKCGKKMGFVRFLLKLCESCYRKEYKKQREEKGIIKKMEAWQEKHALVKTPQKKEKSSKKEQNATISLIVGGIVGWAATRYLFLPFINIFFKMPLWGIVLSYIWFIFVCVGAAGVMLSATTAVERVAYGKPSKEKDDSLSQIKKLKELKDSGAISEKEFKDKKKKLLEKI